MANLALSLQDLDRRYETSRWIQPLNGTSIRLALIWAADGKNSGTLPQPEYREVPYEGYVKGLASIQARMPDSSIDAGLASAVAKHLKDLKVRAQATGMHDDAHYSAVVADLDGLPEARLLELAESILKEAPLAETSAEVSQPAEYALAQLRAGMDAYDLDDWTVHVSDSLVARMSVNGPLKQLHIRADAVFTATEVQRLAVHEIGGHVLRWVNSGAQEEQLATVPLGRRIPTEEGLALFQEERFGLADERVKRIYAARVLGVHLAQSMGATELVRAVSEYVSPIDAAEIVLRAKRGLSDLESPGGSTKDWSYLGGITQMQELADQDPMGLELLFSVKWSAAHLPLAKELEAKGLLGRPRVLADRRLLSREVDS